MIAITDNSIGYDPFSPEVMANPLPFYAQLRHETPVLFLEKYDSFVLPAGSVGLARGFGINQPAVVGPR